MLATIQTYKCQHWHEEPSSLHATQSVVEVKRLITVVPVFHRTTALWPNRVSPLRESYCFNMDNEWFNLSSGCQRTARRDYFLGTVVTFIGLDSGRIGERPLLDRCRGEWQIETDRDRRRGEGKKERNVEEKGTVAGPTLHTSMNSSTSILHRMRNTVSWPWLIKQRKKRHGYNPATLSHRKVTKTHEIVDKGQENLFSDISLCHIFLNMITKYTEHLAHRQQRCTWRKINV